MEIGAGAANTPSPAIVPVMAGVNNNYNNEVQTTDEQSNKRRRKRSIVWEHFTIETVGAGCTRAFCNQCKRSFAYITGSKLAGTSHLKRHIALGICPVSRQRNEQSSLTSGKKSEPPKKRYRASPGRPGIPFDQDLCTQEIAKMIIQLDYPLNIVEHVAFIEFVRTLHPRYNMVNFNTIQGEIVGLYLREKQNLLNVISGIPGRVSLSVDLGMSNQSIGYAYVMGHFLDSDWTLHRRLLNVVMVPFPDSDYAFNQAVVPCLSDWHLDGKLFTLTLDQSFANETMIANLRALLNVRNPFALNAQLLKGNCYARVLSRLAQDALGSMGDTISRIRESVKYVKTSDAHDEKFNELRQRLQVPSTKELIIDDQSKWNTTYHMLVAACELKEVFTCLDTSDPVYKINPSIEEWKQVEVLLTFLKLFYEAANVLMTRPHPPANVFYHEVSKIQLGLTCASMSPDHFVSNLSKPLKEKFDKYWRECFLILAVAVVLDPRYKMELVKFSFSKIFGEDADMWIKIVDDGIHELFEDYMTPPHLRLQAYAEGQEMMNLHLHGNHDGHSHEAPSREIHPQETGYQVMNSQVPHSEVNYQELHPHEMALQEMEHNGFDHQGMPREVHLHEAISYETNTQDAPSQEMQTSEAPASSHEMQTSESPLSQVIQTSEAPSSLEIQTSEPASYEDAQTSEAPLSQEIQTSEAPPSEAKETSESSSQELQNSGAHRQEEVPSAEKQHEATSSRKQNEEAASGEKQNGKVCSDEKQIEEVPSGEIQNEKVSSDEKQNEEAPSGEMQSEEMAAEKVVADMSLRKEKGQEAASQVVNAHEAAPEEIPFQETVIEEMQVQAAADQEMVPQEAPPQEMHSQGILTEEMQSQEHPQELLTQEVPSEEMRSREHPHELLTQDVLSTEIHHLEVLPEQMQSQEHPLELHTQELRAEHMQNQELPQQMNIDESHQQIQNKVMSQDMHSQMLSREIKHENMHPHAFHEDMKHEDMNTQDLPLLSFGDGLSDFDVYISEITSCQHKSELDQYLGETPQSRKEEIDVLEWWKLNKIKYPTLSKLAADILSIPVSTVTSESVFDTQNKKIDSYNSSLRPVTLEALVCAKDWLQYGSSSTLSSHEASNVL